MRMRKRAKTEERDSEWADNICVLVYMCGGIVRGVWAAFGMSIKSIYTLYTFRRACNVFARVGPTNFVTNIHN